MLKLAPAISKASSIQHAGFEGRCLPVSFSMSCRGLKVWRETRSEMFSTPGGARRGDQGLNSRTCSPGLTWWWQRVNKEAKEGQNQKTAEFSADERPLHLSSIKTILAIFLLQKIPFCWLSSRTGSFLV